MGREDLALLTLLLEHFGLRPSMETGLALYTAVLCRSAGFTDCPEFEGFERPALPEGADLVHLGSPWNAALTFKKKYRSSRKP